MQVSEYACLIDHGGSANGSLHQQQSTRWSKRLGESVRLAPFPRCQRRVGGHVDIPLNEMANTCTQVPFSRPPPAGGCVGERSAAGGSSLPPRAGSRRRDAVGRHKDRCPRRAVWIGEPGPLRATTGRPAFVRRALPLRAGVLGADPCVREAIAEWPDEHRCQTVRVSAPSALDCGAVCPSGFHG